MIKMDYQSSYCLLEFEVILNFIGNFDDIFDWIWTMDDFLQDISLNVVISYASFKLTCDA